MPRKRTKSNQPLLALLDASEFPVYAIDGERRIIYCNAALVAWAELPAEQIIGRLVEYHSDSGHSSPEARDAAGPLTGLCPPPAALLGERAAGTISCLARDGRLTHRRAEFVPLRRGESCLLAFVSPVDLSSVDLAAAIRPDASADDLHRAIRQFRREHAARYAADSLLGRSPAIERVRAQIAAAAAATANVLIGGSPGSGRSHVARAIHYHDGPPDADAAPLIPVDCRLATEESLRRAFDSLAAKSAAATRATLLLEQAHSLPPPLQSMLLNALQRKQFAARIIATIDRTPAAGAAQSNGESIRVELSPALCELLATIEIHLPRLVERIDDLPVLAQHFLESMNQGSSKQIGSLRAEALDLLALYSWPGELNQLREVIAAAHAAANPPDIGPSDLPPLIHHAAKAAALPKRTVERIVLDELLARIETEAITRALAQARGNKSEAAELLGMTRPRLYRRLEQLGLEIRQVREPVPRFEPLPDFREIDAEEPPNE